MSLIKKLAGETAIYGLSSILGRILHYVLLTIYLTRELSKYEFGIFTDIYAMAALLLVIFTYRMETAFFRFGSKGNQLENTFSTAALSIIGSTLIFGSILLFFADHIASWLTYPDKSRYVKYFALIISFDALSAIPFARLRLENRPIRFAIIKLLSILANIAIVLFLFEGLPWLIEKDISWASSLYQEEYRLDYVFVSNVIASLVVLLLLFPLFFKTKLQFDPKLWKQMMRYAGPLIIVGVAGVINQSFAVPLQKYFLGEDLLSNLETGGVYGAAAKLAILMNLFTFAFNYAAEPFFFNQAAQSDSKTIYAQVAQAFTMVACIVFLGILLYLDLIQFLLGEDFRGGLEIVPILLMSYLLLGLYYNFSIWYKLTDRTIYGAYIAIGAAIITLSLNYFLLPRIGYIASAWAALACYFFMAMMGYLLGRKYFPVPYKLFNMFGYILLALVVYFISQQIRLRLPEMVGTGSPNIWVMIGINTVLLIVYLGILYGWERKTIRGFLK